MPAAVLVPALASVIGGGIAAGAVVYGAKKQAGSAREAANIQGRAMDEALEQEKRVEAQRQKEYEEEQKRKIFLEDEERQLAAEALARKQAHFAPYAKVGTAGAESLLALMGKRPDVNMAILPRPGAPPQPMPPGVSPPMMGMPSMNAMMAPGTVPGNTLAELARMGRAS